MLATSSKSLSDTDSATSELTISRICLFFPRAVWTVSSKGLLYAGCFAPFVITQGDGEK